MADNLPSGRNTMNLKYLKHRLMNDDDASGGGGKITPEMQAVIDAEVAGLKTKNAELIRANKDLRTKHDALAAQFEGVDMDAMKTLLANASKDDEAKLIAAGKMDEVVSRRTERMRTELEGRASAAEKRASAMMDRALADAVRGAAAAVGALPEASEDFVLRSRGAFKFTDDGDVVVIDREGQTVYGKDGKTPLTPKEWAETLRASAPHLWPRATGTGAAGNSGGQAAKKFSELTEAERVALYRESPEKFEQARAQT